MRGAKMTGIHERAACSNYMLLKFLIDNNFDCGDDCGRLSADETSRRRFQRFQPGQLCGKRL